MEILSSNHTEVTVPKLLECDLCKDGTLAAYDAKLQVGRFIGWGNVCEKHFKEFGMGLGLGLGQKLILKPEEEE